MWGMEKGGRDVPEGDEGYCEAEDEPSAVDVFRWWLRQFRACGTAFAPRCACFRVAPGLSAADIPRYEGGPCVDVLSEDGKEDASNTKAQNHCQGRALLNGKVTDILTKSARTMLPGVLCQSDFSQAR